MPIDKERSSALFAHFPKPRDLQFKTQRGDLSIREFLSLRECKLHTTVAHRNSLIGKVASESQLLFSDLRILQQGPECVEQLGKLALAKKLQVFLDVKKRQINTHLWSALLAQNEHREFWRSKNYDRDYPKNNSLETKKSLGSLTAFVNRVLAGHYDFTDAEYKSIEQHLGQLRFGDGGQLLSQYLVQINTLQLANTIIQSRLKRPLCFQQKANTKAHYFDNVVRTYFITKVQSRAVKLNQRAEVLLQAHKQLETPLLQYAKANYQAWAKQRDSLFRQGKAATNLHVQLIQQLYKQCNLMPGNSK